MQMIYMHKLGKVSILLQAISKLSKAFKTQTQGTEQGNQGKTKAGSSGQGLIPTLGLH